MASLTEDQIEFLESKNIPLYKVFDATGLDRKEWPEAMRALDMWIAYGVSPCREEGHTLRTRAGHCIQCNPANLSYLLRHNSAGKIYVAESPASGLVKVGTSNNPDARVSQLNYYGYGGRRDWALIYSCDANRAGVVESDVHQLLTTIGLRSIADYYKGGARIECRELFACPGILAINAVKTSLEQLEGGAS